MTRMVTACTASALAAMLLASAVSADDSQPSAAAKLARARFDNLKRLAGDWSGMAGHGADQHEATVSYKVTSGGSAVQETLFCNTAHEMVTLYHMDGDALLLTHYCAAGNQPRMKAAATGEPTKIEFRFLDGTNLNPAKDLHMHEATLEWVDNDHIRSAWTTFTDGKAGPVAKFDLRRKK